MKKTTKDQIPCSKEKENLSLSPLRIFEELLRKKYKIITETRSRGIFVRKLEFISYLFHFQFIPS